MTRVQAAVKERRTKFLKLDSKMYNISTSCRTCMNNDVSLVNLFETLEIGENINPQLADVLMECTTTEVSKQDGLPQNVCVDCVKIMEMSYKFRLQASKAYKEFRKLIVHQTTVKVELDDIEYKSEPVLDYFESYDDDCENDDKPPKQEPEEKEYECNKCQKRYSNEKRFLKHLLTHQTSLSCTICNKSFMKQSSLDKHISKHEKQNMDMGQNLLNDINKVEVKTENAINDNQYQCSECNSMYSTLRSLSMHMKKHKSKTRDQNMKMFKCDNCEKEFSVKSHLKRHLKLHSGDELYECNKCPKRYSRRDQLVDHLNKHNGIKPNICPHCNKAFGQLCSLKDHIRTHTGETPYLCSQCGRGFNNSSNLRQHMMRHTGLKPFSCTLCPKTFCTKGQMTCHMSTHTGAHPHKCDECGAAFTKPNSLKKHKLIHLGVKQFACDVCTMRFSCKDHLKRHYRIHTGEKPYRCKYCERAFTQSNDLVKHTRSHVGQNIYQCTVCEMRFRLLSELKLHYPTHYSKGTELAAAPPDKDTEPVLLLNPPTEDDVVKIQPEVDKDNADGRITITFNSNILDKNGLAGNITINISPEKS